MNNPLFRPPAEADSLILQIDQGCPHNRCTFCGMYRNVRYRRLSLDEVGVLVAIQARRNSAAQRIFLADGDVMSRPFEELQAILGLLLANFPRITRISLYANGSSIADKTPVQLQALRALRLHTLYLGMESGDEETLTSCRKGETADGMVRAGLAAQAAGLRLSVMVLLGLGGAARSREHAAATAAALNFLQPRLLSALRVIPVRGTELHAQVRRGEFQPLTERAAVQELRDLIAGLELTATVFRANHSSNVVALEGRLPHDKTRLLDELDRLLASGVLDALTPGPQPLWL